MPGRCFTHSMYNKLKIRDRSGNLLKPHHHIHINKQFRLDVEVWKVFLLNTTAHQLCWPFIDFSDITIGHTLNFYSDASKAKTLGMGVVYNDKWLFARWEEGFIEKYDPSIEFLELLALCAAVFAWG